MPKGKKERRIGERDQKTSTPKKKRHPETPVFETPLALRAGLFSSAA